MLVGGGASRVQTLNQVLARLMSDEEAVTMLREHHDGLERLAAAPLEHESLEQADVYRIAAVDALSPVAAAAPPA